MFSCVFAFVKGLSLFNSDLKWFLIDSNDSQAKHCLVFALVLFENVAIYRIQRGSVQCIFVGTRVNACSCTPTSSAQNVGNVGAKVCVRLSRIVDELVVISPLLTTGRRHQRCNHRPESKEHQNSVGRAQDRCSWKTSDVPSS